MDGLKQTKRKVSFETDSRRKRLFASFKYDANKRNPFTNMILYELLLASLIATIILILLIIDEFRFYKNCMEDGWVFFDKGVISGFLLSAFTFVGVSKIIKWHRSGISLLTVSFFIIISPLIWCSFSEFLWFSIPSILGIVLLWGILHLKKNGMSTWDMCKAEPRWVKYFSRIILFIWVCLITCLPPTTGFCCGFRSNIYNNGMRCLYAHFEKSPYYAYDLYLEILLGTDFKDDIHEKKKIADSWLSKAKDLNNQESKKLYRIDDELSETALFINNLIFILNNKSNQDALDYIDSMKNDIDLSLVRRYLNGAMHSWCLEDYYEPNKERITSLLHQAGLFEDIEN